jgi:hypothetical protein
MSLYKGWWCLLLYALSLAMLVWGVISQVSWTVWLMAVMFLLWDINFVARKESLESRDAEKILSHCRDAETLMSYVIGFYAAVLAVVFTDKDKTKAFLSACAWAHVGLPYVVAPLVLAAVSMLFIPIAFGKKGAADEITGGLKALLLVNIYCEKLVVFTFVTVLLRISRVFI